MKPAQCELQRSIRRLNLFGFSATVLFLGGLGGWAATATLTGAVIGQGTVVVESSIKKVQHPDGGIVGQIFVKEGSVVKEGDVLIRLDDTMTRSSLGATRSQLDEASGREARLLAERDGAESVTFPPEMMSRGHETVVAAAVRGQEKLFQSRRTGRNGQQAQLREQVVQSQEQISGLIAQQQSKENEIRLMRDELAESRSSTNRSSSTSNGTTACSVIRPGSRENAVSSFLRLPARAPRSVRLS